MYCERCGATVNTDARFCSHCGAVREIPVEPPIPVPAFDPGFGNFSPAPDPDLIDRPRPWVRYAARMTDFTILCMAAGATLGIMAPNALENEPFANLFGFVCLILWIFIEPLHLTSAGTTPGKWLFRSRVVRSDGGRITYGAALTRGFQVWWRGLGAGVPIVSLVTMITAHERLSRHGVASWDQEGGFAVEHRRIGAARTALIVVVMLAMAALVIYGYTLEE